MKKFRLSDEEERVKRAREILRRLKEWLAEMDELGVRVNG